MLLAAAFTQATPEECIICRRNLSVAEPQFADTRGTSQTSDAVFSSNGISPTSRNRHLFSRKLPTTHGIGFYNFFALVPFAEVDFRGHGKICPSL